VKTLNIVANSKVFTVQPVPRATLPAFESRMVEIQAIWLTEGFSTADAIARDDCWEHMKAIAAMLPSHENPVNKGVDLELLSNDYQQLERLFFGDASQAYEALRANKGDLLSSFSLDLFTGSLLYELHHYEPKKKLIEAEELRQVKPLVKPLGQKTSQSKVVEIAPQTRSPTLSTDLALETASNSGAA
jgi:hypothetical protein